VQKKIRLHEDVIDLVIYVFDAHVSEMSAKMKVDSKLANYSLYDLEEKIATCQCHHNAMETII
jgi:hypothetical protein